MQSVVKTNTAVWYFDLIPRPCGLGMRLHDVNNLLLYCSAESSAAYSWPYSGPSGAVAGLCLPGWGCLPHSCHGSHAGEYMSHLISLDHCFHSERITKIRTRLKPVHVVACVGIMVRETVYVILYHIVGNFQGRKHLRISRFYGYLRKFSLWNFGAWHLLLAPASNLQNFSPWKSFFPPICESFLPRKFPAIW